MIELSKRHQLNLLKLAEYLESLPPDYEHFDMVYFVNHHGGCDVDLNAADFAAHPDQLLVNCGTIACALGHAPSAGLNIKSSEINTPDDFAGDGINWHAYAFRVFGINSDRYTDSSDLWEFLFSGNWSDVDNTHYGAAARIRYYLAHQNEDIPEVEASAVPHYEPYRKKVDA